MHDLPRGQLDDGKNKTVPEPEIMRLQDVTRPDSRRVIMQEGPPRLAAWSGSAASFQIALDSALGDREAEL